MTYVQAGDVVLHWHKMLAGEPGIVGWSQATGEYEDTDISWQAHGTVGRARGNLERRPAWRMPLVNFTPLPNPVLIGAVRARESELRQAQLDLEARYENRSLYFPFGFSDRRELRAQQTYFVKMPREVLGILDLADLESTPGPKRWPSGDGKAPKGGDGDSGFIADSVVRSAIEWRAVNLAINDYTAHGYEVDYTGASKPYDLVVTKGRDVRRVEVKGSSGKAKAIELTTGEVGNSRGSLSLQISTSWTESNGLVEQTARWMRTGAIRAGGGTGRLTMPASSRRGTAMPSRRAAGLRRDEARP